MCDDVGDAWKEKCSLGAILGDLIRIACGQGRAIMQ